MDGESNGESEVCNSLYFARKLPKMDGESDGESEVQDINLINLVLEKDSRSTETSSQCSVSTSSTATAPNVGMPSVSKIEVALALNKLTDEKLKRLESILITRLEECREKLAETQRIGPKPSEKSSFVSLTVHCGKPYFKDKNFFPAPDNNDTTLMKNTGIFDVGSVSSVSGWTVKDKRNFVEVIHELSRGIKRRQLHSIIAQCHRDAKSGDDKNYKKIEKQMEAVRNEINSLSKRSVAELALPIEEEYDWDMVSLKLDYRHTPTECRALWKLFLHPNINKGNWTKREHTQLQNIAIQYNYQNWDDIAKELDTGRTGYQCFVYYKTNMSNKFSTNKWTIEEEEYLRRLITYYKQGNYIPWGKIVPLIDNKTKLQMYNKYIRMTEKKGRFLPEEDAVLLTCVKKYGTNWKLIAKFLNGRSVSQIKLRHHNLLKTQRISCVWTVEEDRKLVQLMANHEAASYADIAELFPGKDRINIRTRHVTLLKWMKRHPKKDIEWAPRRAARRLIHGQAATELSDALDNLKTRMTKQYNATKTNKVTMESSEETIEHSIIIALMNEKFLEYNEANEPKTSADDIVVCETDENVANLHKLLILLKASLDKKEFLESTKCQKYKDLLKSPDNRTLMPVRSYSKKQPVMVKVEKAPSIWGGSKLTKTEYVLPPSFATIIGCKQLLMKYSNKDSGPAAKAVMNKIAAHRRKNVIFKEQLTLLMERFETLFLWPMLISNKQPRPLSYYTEGIIENPKLDTNPNPIED